MRYFIADSEEVLRVVEDAVPRSRARILEDLGAYFDQLDESPDVVGPSKAAEMLGVQPPHLARLRRLERMPEPIMVEQASGPSSVYLRSEIEALAADLRAERADRRASARPKEEA